MTSQPLNQLMDFLDVAKLKLNPLPPSYIADKADDYLKGIYTTMLASVLATKGIIGENENRFFQLLIDAIGLDNTPSYFINNISHLTQQQVLEFAKNIDSPQKRLYFLFEMLLLARIDSPITDTQYQLINEICNLWNLDNDSLAKLDYWVKQALGIVIDNSNPSPYLKVSKLKYPMLKNYTIDQAIKPQNSWVTKDTKIISLTWNPEKNIKGMEDSIRKISESLKVVAIAQKTSDREEDNKLLSAHSTGILYDFHEDQEGIINVSILECPSYLDQWHSYFQQINTH